MLAYLAGGRAALAAMPLVVPGGEFRMEQPRPRTLLAIIALAPVSGVAFALALGMWIIHYGCYIWWNRPKRKTGK